MSTGTREVDSSQVDELDDLDEAWDLLMELQIDTSGVADLAEAKRRLRAHYSKETRTATPNDEVVTKILEKDQSQRKDLVDLFNRTKTLIDELPETMAADVHRAFPDLDQEIAAAVQDLANKNCAILIAGETSAGKSSLLNLLLGQTKRPLLPVAHLSTTSVICELKYDESPYAVAHPWPDERGNETKHIDLGEEGGFERLSQYLYQKGDRTRRFPYHTVEIFWPSQWLRTGVTIVDSPGIGESEELTNRVTEYTKGSFGFIYVLNSANAGGVQADRLQDLLSKLTSSKEEHEDEGHSHFDPRCAIFVANKWEMVPRREREEVQQDILFKLKRVWTGLSETQVFYISVKEALESMQTNTVSEPYGKLLDGIERLLPTGLKQRVTKHFRFLSMVMKTAMRIVKTYLTQLEISDMEREERCEAAMKHLHKIEQSPKKVMKDLEQVMQEKIQEGVDQVRNYLKQDEVKKRLCYWDKYQCPESKDVDTLGELMYAFATKRIQQDINEWDSTNQVFQSIQSYLILELRDMFWSLSSELSKIESRMLSTETERVHQDSVFSAHSDPAEEDFSLNRSEKIFLGVTAPIWVPLGIAVGLFALPIYAFKKGMKKRRLAAYRSNKSEVMAEMTEHLLNVLQHEDKLQIMLAYKIRKACAPFKQMIHRIPYLIEADKQMIDNLRRQRRADTHVLQNLYTICDKAQELLGDMDFMWMLELRTYDIKQENILGWKENDIPVAEGTFAKVFKATLVTPGITEATPCAIKVLKEEGTDQIEPLTKYNVSEAWLEESHLRKLQNEYVVKYLGTALMNIDRNYYHLMVMEFCETNLEKHIYDRQYYLPPSECQDNSEEDRERLHYATNLASQVAYGLHGLHEKGFVHRDLKLANILLTNSHQVRLADLGVSKFEKDISGTLVGTPLYIAPEVIRLGKYNRLADMWSYGFVLCEMWHGKLMAELYPYRYSNQLSKRGFGTERRKRSEDQSPWYKVAQRCWSENPHHRPSASECFEELSLYMKYLTPP